MSERLRLMRDAIEAEVDHDGQLEEDREASDAEYSEVNEAVARLLDED